MRRLTLMRNAEAYDRERLGYRVAKRAFDIAFSAAVIAVGLVPGANPVRRHRDRQPRLPRSTARGAWAASARTAGRASSPCGSSAPCARTPTR